MDSLLFTGIAFLLSEVVEDFCFTALLIYTFPMTLTEPGSAGD